MLLSAMDHVAVDNVPIMKSGEDCSALQETTHCRHFVLDAHFPSTFWESSIKNSSTLQELRCMTSAVRHWLTTASGGSGVCTYLTDARNLVYLVKKGRSKQAGINQELLELGLELRASGRAVRVVWQSREEPLAKAADCLSRGLIPPFKQLLPMHPALEVRAPASQ